MNFKKVIIWDYLMLDHTSSYFWGGYYKAFKALGYDTIWTNVLPKDFDFTDTLFFVQGNKTVPPFNNKATYVVHNLENFPKTLVKNWMGIQIITNDVYPRAVEKIDDAVYYDAGERMLYQPWATDLLPAEIDFNWINLPREREINWCGSIWDGDMGNRDHGNR